MIGFDRDGFRFNYRIAGVAIHDGRLLVHRVVHESFWTLPGGRAELGESAEDTIRREMREELSTEIEVVRLLWLVENFFEYDGSSYHELAFYFLIRFPDGSWPLEKRTFESVDGETRLQFEWLPVDVARLTSLPLLPSFLAQGLARLPESPVHVVHRDNVSTTLRP